MENQFGIDLQKVISSTSAWQVNKMLATKLSLHPYFKIGEVFKNLSDEDVKFLASSIHNLSENDSAELYLMMLLLSIGHELQPENEQVMDQWCNELCDFIVCEHISRSGASSMLYENMVFGGDFQNVPFMKMNDMGLELIADILNEEQTNA